MLSFEASSFAIAGTIAAVGPIIIHLLNRRRFKTVSWAAMDFLREALERNRKILHLRDILLLVLRMLAVVLFGLVLSRPFYKGNANAALWQALILCVCFLIVLRFSIGLATSSRGRGRGFLAIGLCAGLGALGFQLYGLTRKSSEGNESTSNAKAPVHAVLIVDNSRSLGVESLGGTLLDRAKSKAIEFINSLPPESRITVIPSAGSEETFSLDAYRNKEDARRALEHVKLVDCEASVLTGLEQADQACRQTLDPPTKRVVLLTDLQETSWRSGIPGELIRRLSGLQIANVAHGSSNNIWVTGLKIEDGLTSAEVPCRLLARIHSSGGGGVSDLDSSSEPLEVQVKLLIDGSEVASQAVELVPGQEREIEFTHQFDVLADPLKPGSAVATVTVQSELPAADQLSNDNRQQIVVPIVASLPVIFVDQYGDEENVEQNKIGETYALRHLMAPRSNTDKSQRRLIHIEHLRIDQLSQQLLETARLVVVAGVEKPDDSSVRLLREYVQQGGPLVLLAGSHFDPAAWTEHAWLGGQGILPAPLDRKPIGMTPEEAPQLVQPFYATFSSMHDDIFLIEWEDPSILASLFESTPFFKAVKADLSNSVLDELLGADTKRFSEERSFLIRYAAKVAGVSQESTKPSLTDGARVNVDDDRTLRKIEPAWWNWRSPFPLVDRALAPADLAKRYQPRELATFDGDRGAFVVERFIGAGRVILFTSGVTSDWNLLRGSGAMYVFHRTCCQLMERTLSTRNYLAGQKIVLPVEGSNDVRHNFALPRRGEDKLKLELQQGSNVRYSVARPSGVKETLNVDAIGANLSGVSILRPLVAGTYVVSSELVNSTTTEIPSNKLEEIFLAVNGSESESILTSISVAELQQKLGQDDVRVLSVDEPIHLEGGARRGQDLWKFLGWSVLGCLLLEKAVLASATLRKSGQAVQR